MNKIFIFIFSLSLLLISLPIMIIISLIILIFDGRPIFFLQKRSGLNGRIFILYKFRTMKNTNSKNDRTRVTKLGKVLRNFKLDELPQLFNMLIGDLNLIGPRPLLPEYNKHYNKKQKNRLSINPGITGWAQINEKRNTTWKKRLELDIWYIENKSLLLDFKIIFRTILMLIKMIYKKNNRVTIITKRFDEKN